VTLHLRDASVNEADQEGLLRRYLESSERLHEELEAAARVRLGDGFVLSPLQITPGSIDFTATILALPGALITYGALRTGIHYLLGDLANLIARYAPRATPVTLVPTLISGAGQSALALPVDGNASAERFELLRHVLLLNLLLVGAVLICLFVLLVAAID
jgi:hypothetical protein